MYFFYKLSIPGRKDSADALGALDCFLLYVKSPTRKD